MKNYESILNSWLSTADMVSMVMSWPRYTDEDYPKELWEGVAGTLEEAEAYYAELDEDYRREQAAEILAQGGWDMRKINFKKS